MTAAIISAVSLLLAVACLFIAWKAAPFTNPMQDYIVPVFTLCGGVFAVVGIVAAVWSWAN